MNKLIKLDPRYTVVYAGVHPAGLGGDQIIIRCSNGYGVSVIQTPFSYGNHEGDFEVAMLHFDEENNYEIIYTDLVDNNVIVIHQDELIEFLEKIANYKP